MSDENKSAGDPWRKILEHEFRLDAMERLFNKQEEVIETLSKSINNLEKSLEKTTSRLILALIVVSVLGNNALPFLLKLGGM